MSDHVLHLGDCLDPLRGLATLADKSVDHVICDPPYGDQIYDNLRSNTDRAGPHPNAKRIDAKYGALPPDEFYSVCREVARVARRWVLVFSDVESVHEWRAELASLGIRHVRVGAFVKLNPMPQLCAWPAQGFEAIQISHAKDAAIRWNRGGKPARWMGSTAQADGQEVIHTTQKPLSLMDAIVSDFTDPGDLICDPFAGSGTTLVACKRLGRRAIGWEKDATFWERAVRRLENTKQQYELLPRGPKPKQTRLLP